MRPGALWTAALLLVAPVGLAAQRPSGQAVADEVRWRVERLRATGMVRIGDDVVRNGELMLAVYEGRGYQPLWTSAAAESLVRAVDAARADGLEPEDYHLSALAGARATDPSRLAELDLLRTDALLRLGHDLRYGRVEPQGPADNPPHGWPAGDAGAAEDVIELARSGRMHEALLGLRPRHFAYEGLVQELARLRWIQRSGGWEAIPDQGPMRPDSTDQRVPLLRTTLALRGDLLAVAGDTSRVYGREIEAAVRSFQRRHGLDEDGVVGAATFAQLNVPVEARIAQVRINLERVRWVGHILPDTFVAVSIPGARVQLVQAGEIAFETRAVVGRVDDPTPAFSADLRYVDLNPTWTVPAGIVQEVLAQQRADTSYLRRQGIRLLDASGREVDVSAVDLSTYTQSDFPYVIRQDPGPLNPLGRIKLMLPNEHHVYLHDTPERGLFDRERRFFSHGCVRVDDPLGLAELVLGDPLVWNRETLTEAIAGGETRTLLLDRPVPVFVLYWTAAAQPDGTVRYDPDAYAKDVELLSALGSPQPNGTPGHPPR